jgi:mannose-6-phosphate isomerase-like protein (cupin superfamily)
MAKIATKSKAAPKRAATAKSAAAARAKRATAPRAAAEPGPKTARLKTAAPAQRFTVSHLNEKDFKRDGLRPYAFYRDLGISGATGGLAQAHVIRLIPPCTDEVRKRHTHAVELQLVYVLKGWMKNEFDGHGEQLMREGSCWLQPPNIRHTVLDYSDDCEVLEIIVPAEFKTVEV